MEYRMKLHENQGLFADAIIAASRPKGEGGLGIKSIFIEKDYWICRSLSLLATADTDNLAVFKGGTSLSKAYGIGHRFSEDIDIAISEAWMLNGNQLKNLIRTLLAKMTQGLTEISIPGLTSKGSNYRKVYFSYPRAVHVQQVSAITPGQLLIEINAFANPYPYSKRSISSFLTEFLLQTNNESLIKEYEMAPFDINVLDFKRTLTEKIVSLLRCSFSEYNLQELKAKIRHFYDLHYILRNDEAKEYVKSPQFITELSQLFAQDQQRFDKPAGWQQLQINQSILLSKWHDLWQQLRETYQTELPDISYQQVPSPEEIEHSIQTLFDLINQ
jgi:hypothetical protein